MTKANLRRSIHLMNRKAENALKEAVTETIRDHYRTGDPLAIWRDGRVQWVRAEKLLPLRELKKRAKKSTRTGRSNRG